MKAKSITMILLLTIFSISGAMAQEVKKEKIKVGGSCGMCDTRIEDTAKEIDGVQKAEYNLGTQILVVKYDSDKTSSGEIQKKIAEVGHDTKLYKAKDEVYNALPGCCKYRKE